MSSRMETRLYSFQHFTGVNESVWMNAAHERRLQVMGLGRAPDCSGIAPIRRGDELLAL